MVASASANQGKEERFHRTLKAEVLQGRSFRDLDDCQRHFDPFRDRYNLVSPSPVSKNGKLEKGMPSSVGGTRISKVEGYGVQAPLSISVSEMERGRGEDVTAVGHARGYAFTSPLKGFQDLL